MTINKMYFTSLGLNFIPIITVRIVKGNMTGDENMIYVLYFAFFLLAAILNLSFFRLKKRTDYTKKKIIFSGLMDKKNGEKLCSTDLPYLCSKSKI
jgi:hypothetical protein